MDTAYARIKRLLDEAVRSGQFRNQTQVLEACGLTSGYLRELQGRAERNPTATIRAETAIAIAKTLGVSLYAVAGGVEQPASDDPDTERAWATVAARAMQVSEAAIQVVLAEEPGAGDRWYWWLRFETEARRLSGPSTSPSSKSRDTPGGVQSR